MSPRVADPHAREALLAAARAEFSRQGLEATRIEDITRRAGLSKGAYYLHFDSKEDAFQELLSRFFGALEEHALRRREQEAEECHWLLKDLTTADILDGTQRFASALELQCKHDVELLETLWRHREFLGVLVGTGQAYEEQFQEFRERMAQIVAGNTLADQARGAWRKDLDPQAVADIVVGSYESLARRMARLREKPDLHAWARTLLTVIFFGTMDRAPGARLGGQNG